MRGVPGISPSLLLESSPFTVVARVSGCCARFCPRASYYSARSALASLQIIGLPQLASSVPPGLRLPLPTYRSFALWHDRIASPTPPPTVARCNHTSHLWVRQIKSGAGSTSEDRALTASTVEKRPSTDGLVDNIDPRESHELEELPYVEKPATTEPAPLPLKEKLITCFWIALNTLSTLGLIFLSKKYAHHRHLLSPGHG
jgi:hypothetical protein